MAQRFCILSPDGCQPVVRRLVAVSAHADEPTERLNEGRRVVRPPFMNFEPAARIPVGKPAANLAPLISPGDDHAAKPFPVTFAHAGTDVRKPATARDEIDEQAAPEAPVLPGQQIRHVRQRFPSRQPSQARAGRIPATGGGIPPGTLGLGLVLFPVGDVKPDFATGHELPPRTCDGIVVKATVDPVADISSETGIDLKPGTLTEFILANREALLAEAGPVTGQPAR